MAQFPSSVADNSYLYDLKNGLVATLSGTIDELIETIGVDSTTDWPDEGIFVIGTEAITYTGKTDTTFTGCTRGADDSTAAAHTSGDNVELNWTALHGTRLRDEIIAIEQNITDRFGSSGTNVVVSGTLSVETPTEDEHAATKLYIDNINTNLETMIIDASGIIVTDHGNLTGLADDDHTQYILVDGTRAFTGVIDGVTPTSASNLTTKSYVDTLVAASGLVVETTVKSYTDSQVAASGALVEQSANTYTDEQIAANPGVTDHGALTGLSDDDHTQYALLNGIRHFSGNTTFDDGIVVNSGIVVNGDGVDGEIAASGNLILKSDELGTGTGNVTIGIGSDVGISITNDGAGSVDEISIDAPGGLSITGSGMFSGDVRTEGSYYGDGSKLTGVGAATDHSTLTNLDHDDHTQYLLTDGSRHITNGLVIEGSGLFTGDVVIGNQLSATGSLDISADSAEAGLGILTLGIGHAPAITINNDLHGGPGNIIIGADWDDYGNQSVMIYAGDNKTLDVRKDRIDILGSGHFTNDLFIDGSIHGIERRVRFVMDNGTSNLETGRINAGIMIPAMHLTEWNLLVYPSGSISLDILSGNITSLPPNTSITGGNYPSVTEDNKNTSSTLTGWTDTLPEDTVLDVNVLSCSGITKCFFDLYGVEL